MVEIKDATRRPAFLGGRLAVILGCTSMASICANAAFAQTASGADGASGNEIIVTAQKRSENIQNVPLTVQALSAQTLTNLGAKQLSDYAATIPGLQVDTGGAPGIQTITIRGISTGNLGGSSTTAVYVDDVPIGSSSPYAYGASFGLDVMPYDLSRVEVLEGPQGTLYGASSMGGLLKYVLNTPDLSRSSFRLGGDLSSIDHGSRLGTSERGYANVVLVPGELAVSVSGAHSYVPGYIDNVFTGRKNVNDGTQNSVRAALYWEPNKRLSVKLSALYNASDFNDVAIIEVNPNGTPTYGSFNERGLTGRPAKARTTLLSGNVSYDFGGVKLTSVTGYSDVNNRPTQSLSNAFFNSLGIEAYFYDALPVKKFTQELRLGSSVDNARFQWSVGGFYTHEKAQLNEYGLPLDLVDAQPNPTYTPLDSISRQSLFREEAAFANATYKIIPAWDVSAGVRYSHNEQSVATKGTGEGGSQGYVFGNATASPRFVSSESVTTYSVSSQYHFNRDVMAYVRVATGYRPGGSNAGVPGAPATFTSDTLTNYEVGVKSELFDRRLLFNFDLFYIDWKDIQLGAYTSTNLVYTGNAGAAKSKGFELTTRFAATPEISIGANAVYNDAKLSTDAPAVGGAKGDRLPLSAKWNLSATAAWTHSIGNERKISASATWRYTSDRYADFPLGGNFFRFKSYNALDLSLGYDQARWSVRLFARNVTNETAYLRYNATYATVLQPRTIGLGLDFKY